MTICAEGEPVSLAQPWAWPAQEVLRALGVVRERGLPRRCCALGVVRERGLPHPM